MKNWGNKSIFKYLGLILFSFQVLKNGHALTEIGGKFGYDRQVYGDNRESKIIGRTYEGSIAFYFWKLTAVEFNYRVTDDIITDNLRRNIGTNTDIVSQQDRVTTQIFGIGIRQALATRKAFLQPVISFGYAKQYTDGTTDYLIEESGSQTSLEFDVENSEEDSLFAALALKFSVTKRLSLNGSIETVAPWGELDQARDNVYYAAGFSWYL